MSQGVLLCNVPTQERKHAPNACVGPQLRWTVSNTDCEIQNHLEQLPELKDSQIRSHTQEAHPEEPLPDPGKDHHTHDRDDLIE